jgi:predicted NUDIX family NTP pyrophosphohydrolase
MVKKSAGILAFRKEKKEHEVLLVHPGGPFWKNKDLNAWSVPKGEFDESEDPLSAAKREFKEETGYEITGEFSELEPVKQSGGKIIYSWAVEANIDATKIKSNNFKLEWPPKSGKFEEFPEVDKAEWFTFEKAMNKIVKGQIPVLEQLVNKLGVKI